MKLKRELFLLHLTTAVWDKGYHGYPFTGMEPEIRDMSEVRSCDPRPDELTLCSKRSACFHSVSSTLPSEAQRLNSYVVTFCQNISSPYPPKELQFFSLINSKQCPLKETFLDRMKGIECRNTVISHFCCHSDSIPQRATSGFGSCTPGPLQSSTCS